MPSAVSTAVQWLQSVEPLKPDGRLIAVPTPSRWAMRSIDELLLDDHDTMQRPAPVSVVAPEPGSTLPNDVADVDVQPLVSCSALGIVAEMTVLDEAPNDDPAASIAVASSSATVRARRLPRRSARGRAAMRVRDRGHGMQSSSACRDRL